MHTEIRQIPAVVQALLSAGRSELREAANRLRQLDPELVITVARGSSDHAATYFKYACEIHLGLPVASVGPSVSSIYKAKLKLPRTACVGISQSGQSPDIVSLSQSLSRENALTVAVTNDPRSPLANASDLTIPIQAGPEQSVAATKTFVASVVAALALVAHWSEDKAMLHAIDALPDTLSTALHQDWSALQDALVLQPSLFTIGRGPAYAIAHEAALKFKETCQIHAEAYSSAEVLHGPVSVVEKRFPVLAFAAEDAAETSIANVCDQLAQQGANVFATTSEVQHATLLPHVRSGHPLTDPLVLAVSFYAFVEGLARDRGINPDHPRNLRKVTETI